MTTDTPLDKTPGQAQDGAEDNTKKEMARAYNHKDVEERLYKLWEDGGYFTPKIDHSRPPEERFTIIMPPPNVTGELHLGHALTATLEDIMTRWHRMRGDVTLWLPGRDHASIAAQNVVEQALAREGVQRQDLGRDGFLQRMWEWMDKYSNIITEQHKRLGASCDWSRERFTMDPGPSKAVRTTFVNLYDKGLIYRGLRIINWCPRCSTALSDLEVDHKEVNSYLWYVRYPIADEPGKYITVATTRPETMLGDTAVAVNPHDERHMDLIGKDAMLPVLNRRIPIIADEAVDYEFGTGAVKITPAHDPVDFEVAQRHNLPQVVCIGLDAQMTDAAGPYQGMDRFECRRAIVSELERDGLIAKIEDYTHSIGHCYRCDTIVEPIVSEQWFLKVASLADRAMQAVADGSIKIVPDRFTKVYFNWMENLRDWCISRQLWWGHRIPVWYCRKCSTLTAAVDDATECSACKSTDIYQDPDVLDTWFSSALWPHSTLGWPDDTEDFSYFYPTTVMETGYDILFFWVARMIMMGLENTGKAPFQWVYLHGLIRDEHGNKMSKTRGNVVNPLDAIDQYGTDALRFTLSTGGSPGNDMRLSAQKLEGSRNFANKLWNASRFVISNLDPDEKIPAINPNELRPAEDWWILRRLDQTIDTVNSFIGDFQFGMAGQRIYDFIWNEFCDWYIEFSKIRLRSGPSTLRQGLGQAGIRTSGRASPKPVLVHVLDQSLRLLHPYMPFITEEVWGALAPHLESRDGEALIVAPYPKSLGQYADKDVSEDQIELAIEVIRAIRNARAEYKVEASRFIDAIVQGGDPIRSIIASHMDSIKTLARLASLETIPPDEAQPKNAIPIVLSRCEVYIPLSGMIDIAGEESRLTKEIEQVAQEVSRLEAKLSQSDFVAKAPEAVVNRERERLMDAKGRFQRLETQLAALKS